MKRLPSPPWTLAHALAEVEMAAAWADGMGYLNVAPRLEFAAKIIKRDLARDATLSAEKEK